MQLTVADLIRSRLQVRLDLPTPEKRRQLRTTAGLSQRELADAVGVTPQAICQYEKGVRVPQGERLSRYVEALRALQEAA